MVVKLNAIAARTALLCFALALASFLLPGLAQAEGSAAQIKEVRFARGTSGAQYDGAVVRGDRDVYSIKARKGQRMTLRIVAAEKNAAVQVYAPGAKTEIRDSTLNVSGVTLRGAGEGDDAAKWTGTLPKSGTYVLVVGSTRGNATYRLNIMVH
jgi:hypothetical protein